MKKTFSLLLLSASLALPAAAQQDPKAGKILDQMSSKYQALKAFQATFTQTLENPAAKVKQNLSGDITVSGQKFRLKMSGQEVINNGTTTWTYLKNENEVNISDSDPDTQEMSPSQIYTMYKKGYKYTYVQQVTEAARPST
jgi:outer membrane lipoprotein carrier protein